LTKNMDGSPKTRAAFWQPNNCDLFIPSGEGLHNRPIIRMATQDRDHVALLVVYQNRIDGFVNGQRRALINFDFGNNSNAETAAKNLRSW